MESKSVLLHTLLLLLTWRIRMFFHQLPAQEHVWTLPLAGVIRIPTDRKDNTEVPPYSQIPHPIEHREHVEWMITTIAECSLPGLAIKRSEFKRREAVIIGLHPLKFLCSIFNPQKPHLKGCMQEIANYGGLKWEGFMGGLRPSMTREADRNRLNMYVDDFAIEVGVHPSIIRPYFHSRDWEGLVHALLAN